MAEAVLAEFECPICVSYMTPASIRQCVQGHLFCSKCFTIIRSCAICRAEKSDDGCLALERVHSSLKFPCKYRDDGDGCGYNGKSTELAAHEILCQPMRCSLKFFECRWQGKFSKILEHCKLEHENNVIESDRIELSIAWFEVLQREFKIVSAFDTLFLCLFEIKPNCQMELSVVHIGNPSITDQFSLNVTIIMKCEQTVVKLISEDDKKRTFLIRNKCMTLCVCPNGTFKRESYISCLLNIFRKYSENRTVDEVTMYLHELRIQNDPGNSTNLGSNTGHN